MTDHQPDDDARMTRAGNHQDGTRQARADMGDDLVLPFTVDALNVRGRIAHLGAAVDTAIRQHDLPAPVARLLAEAMALAAMLGSLLKVQGKLILQAQTNGPVRLLVADFRAPDAIRGLARFDENAIATLMEQNDTTPQALLGSGQLVFTIDQGPHTRRYQGVVALQGDLQQAAQDYFASSEQIPTRVKLAAGTLTDESGEHWRAGAMMIQHLPPAAGNAAQDGDNTQPREKDAQHHEDDWNTAQALFDTLQDQELLDPAISPERLAYRLFHEQGVKVFEPVRVRFDCGCDRDRLRDVLRRFSAEERRDMLAEDGKIHATCEFCNETYTFTPEELET